MLKRIAFAIVMVFLLSNLVFTKANAGNDFVVVDLRTDLPEIVSSKDYQVWIAANGGPRGNFPTFTTAWLSVNLDNKPGLYGHQFSQVGLMANASGLFWFVYAESGVECWRGSNTYWSDILQKYLGCYGDIGDIVELGEWYRVELVSYGQGFWIARIHDGNNNVYDLAKILSTSNNVYDIDVVMEEGWTQNQDPFEYGLFHFWHPEYNSWVDGFREWPTSSSYDANKLYTYPESICPDHYGANINLMNDIRNWVAGTDGKTCNANMFMYRIVIPVILDDE